MATAPQADILRDVKPGQLVRLYLVGGGELAGDFQGYTDEMDHTYAWVSAREGRATVRVAHVAGVVEITRPAMPPPDVVPESERCKECQGRPCSRCEGTGREPTP